MEEVRARKIRRGMLTFDLKGGSIVAGFHNTAEGDGDICCFAGAEDRRVLADVRFLGPSVQGRRKKKRACMTTRREGGFSE